MLRSLRVLTSPATGRRFMASFKDDAKKTVVRNAVYGMHLDKYDEMAAFVNKKAPEIRAQPGMKSVEVAVCGGGRLQVAYEFTDLDSFKAYMGSKFYEDLKADLMKEEFIAMSK